MDEIFCKVDIHCMMTYTRNCKHNSGIQKEYFKILVACVLKEVHITFVPRTVSSCLEYILNHIML